MTVSVERALIIGAAGQVAGALIERLGAERCVGTVYNTPYAGGIPYVMGVASEDQTRRLLDETQPTVVFIAAGFTNVEKCESEPEAANAANRDGPALLAGAARAAGARTVFYSTEYVFDGADGPYGEDDAARPVSVYGRSKLEGEHAVLEADPDALILRTTVVFGPETQGKNFCYRLAGHLLSGDPISVPGDQISSPTYNRDLARASVALVEAGASGVFNVVGPELMPRDEMARRVAAVLGRDASLVRPVATADFGQAAARPLRAGLRIDRLRATIPDVFDREPLRTVEGAVEHWRENQRGKPWPK